MPISKITKDGCLFTPDDTELLAVVFETTLQKLNLNRADPLAYSIAKEMIAVLRKGERDPEKLSASALKAVGLGPADEAA